MSNTAFNNCPKQRGQHCYWTVISNITRNGTEIQNSGSQPGMCLSQGTSVYVWSHFLLLQSNKDAIGIQWMEGPEMLLAYAARAAIPHNRWESGPIIQMKNSVPASIPAIENNPWYLCSRYYMKVTILSISHALSPLSHLLLIESR